jgi:hypothetical protein
MALVLRMALYPQNTLSPEHASMFGGGPHAVLAGALALAQARTLA